MELAGGWDARSVAEAVPCGSAVGVERNREVPAILAELAEFGGNSAREAGLAGRGGEGLGGIARGSAEVAKAAEARAERLVSATLTEPARGWKARSVAGDTSGERLAGFGGNSAREAGLAGRDSGKGGIALWSEEAARADEAKAERLVSATLTEPAGGWKARSVAGDTRDERLAEFGGNSAREAGLVGRGGDC